MSETASTCPEKAIAGTSLSIAAIAAPTVPESLMDALTLGPELMPVTTRSGGLFQPTSALRPSCRPNLTVSAGVALGEPGVQAVPRHSPKTAPREGAERQSDS